MSGAPRVPLAPVILGLDVGLVATGWILAAATATEPYWAVTDHGCIRPQRTKKKRGIRAADDMAERCAALFHTLTELGLARTPQRRVVGIIAELPTMGSKSTIAARSMSAAVAVIACLRAAHRLPAEWTTPAEGRQAFTGRALSSKTAVQQEVLRRWPMVAWPLHKTGKDAGKPIKKLFEHQADAMAALYAARNGNLHSLALLMTPLEGGRDRDSA